jgi:hypothetical protein
VKFSLSGVRRVLNNLPFRGEGARGRKQLDIPPLETGGWAHDSGQGGCEGVGHNKHTAISCREGLPPISTPRHGTAAVVVSGVIYILGGGLLLAMGDLLS